MKSVLNLLKKFQEPTICPELPKVADGGISRYLKFLRPRKSPLAITSNPILYPSIYTYTHTTRHA